MVESEAMWPRVTQAVDIVGVTGRRDATASLEFVRLAAATNAACSSGVRWGVSTASSTPLPSGMVSRTWRVARKIKAPARRRRCMRSLVLETVSFHEGPDNVPVGPMNWTAIA